MKVVELMNQNVVTCHPLEKLNIILNKLELFKISGMPVVDKGKLVGIISQSDILRGLATGDIAEVSVDQVMTREVIVAAPTESAVVVTKLMVDNDINRIPIVDNEKIVGIVTRGDIIKAVAECG